MIFAGAEAASHRNLLIAQGVTDFSLSFIGLTRRVKNLDKWTISSHFPENSYVFLDSGAHSVNSGEKEKFTQADLKELSTKYQKYVADNLEDISLFSEFDALPLGRDYIEQQRSEFYDNLPGDKFLPIWHDAWGLDYLAEMAERYTNIGITATSLAGRNLAPTLNELARNGIKLHAVGNTSVDDLYNIHWNSTSSLSWISPSKNGETILFTGKVLKRYTNQQKDQARKRYRTLFTNLGFDAEKIEADDHNELLRLSIWSWQQLMNDINERQGNSPLPENSGVEEEELVTTPVLVDTPPISQTEVEVVDTPTPENLKLPATTRQRETKLLPIFGTESSQVTEVNEAGEEVTRVVTNLKIRKESTRICRNCMLAAKCPAFEADSTCAFDFPIELKTRADRERAITFLDEMQLQRVAFMRFVEEQEGGYADPNLSQEIDRALKIAAKRHEMEQEGFSLKIEAKGNPNEAKAGMLSRLFGKGASDKVQALPAPVSADDEIIEAEIVREMPDLDV